MNTVAMPHRFDLDALADKSLRLGVRFWFAVAVAGQVIFAAAVATFYGLTALRGDPLSWKRFLAHGYVVGNVIGNSALSAHLLFATTIMLSGVLQLIPQLRTRKPVWHRWNGRFYVIAAWVQGCTGLYLILSGRTIVGDASAHAASVTNALLILLFAALAWRYARARDFVRHSRWALRLFLVVGGVWFFRVGLMFWLAVNQGPVGFDPATFQGPFVTFLSFAQFLLPLAVLEWYLWARERARAAGRIALAVTLATLTLAMGAGIASATTGMWVPEFKAGVDKRISIARVLSDILPAQGVEAALRQYDEINGRDHADYNLDETELNTLGYSLLHAGKFDDAIRILRRNAEAYPKSSNVYDSLGEAYADAGNKEQAIANYRLALRLDPQNGNSARMLARLVAP